MISAFVLETLAEANTPTAFLSGENRLLNQPEFRDPDKAHKLMSYLSGGGTILPSAEGMQPSDEVRVLIGPENVAEELKDSSVVIASYDAGDNTRGLIGVVGPTRMDYSAVAAKLSFLAAGLRTTDMNEDKNETEELKEENAQEVPTEEKEDKKPEKKDKKAGRKKEDERLTALEAEKEALEKDKAALNDKYLRICAEYDNFRRRSQKEKDNLYGDIKADTVQKFLPVYDNLERALKQGTEDEAYRKGVEMIMTQFNATLEKLGVKKIESLGQTFDPNKHNAVMHVEDESLGENTIVEVFQEGFTVNDKVIRFAMVKVAN